MSESKPPESTREPALPGLTWESIELLCEWMHEKLTKIPYKPVGIVAVSRGGLVPAALLAHKFNIRNMHVLAIHSYVATTNKETEGETQAQLHPLFIPSIPGKGHLYLVVDDICDTGETQTFIRKTWPLAMRACLVQKTPPREYPIGKDAPPIVGCYVPRDMWVHFPWEE